MNTLKRLLNWIFSDYSSRPRAAQRKDARGESQEDSTASRERRVDS